MSQSTYRIPENVVEDTHAFRGHVESYLKGETSADAFRGIRVPMGIYEQREGDTYMVRVRVAAGIFLPHQAACVAELSEAFGNGIVHVTTRQDLQIHRARIEDTPAILDRLLAAGLSTRGGGGNTVRNVSACPLAGACPKEAFDVAPHALALTERLVASPDSFTLPRKYKIAFSGCGEDCALASVTDLGFFAHERDGVQGFAVYAAGGLGGHPAPGILLEEFVPAGQIHRVAEAIKRVFDKHGDREHRSKARLRFVLRRFGPEKFRELYREELRGTADCRLQVADCRPAGGAPTDHLTTQPPNHLDRAWVAANVTAQKQEGLFAVRIPLPLGDIRAPALAALARFAAGAGDGLLRTTQEQCLLLLGIPGSDLARVYEALRSIDPALAAAPPARCVACAGAATCRLGVCLSRGLAAAIERALAEQAPLFPDPIRISGCPNSCGQHSVAWLGLHGGTKRVEGRLVPVYSLFAAGRTEEGNAVLGQPVGKVPARAVPALLQAFWKAAGPERRDGETAAAFMERWGADALRALAAQYEAVPPYEEAPEFFRDFGRGDDFSLAGRGPGECAAGTGGPRARP